MTFHTYYKHYVYYLWLWGQSWHICKAIFFFLYTVPRCVTCTNNTHGLLCHPTRNTCMAEDWTYRLGQHNQLHFVCICSFPHMYMRGCSEPAGTRHSSKGVQGLLEPRAEGLLHRCTIVMCLTSASHNGLALRCTYKDLGAGIYMGTSKFSLWVLVPEVFLCTGMSILVFCTHCWGAVQRVTLAYMR